MQRLKILYSVLLDIIKSIRQDFTPELIYKPYEPKVIGNKLKEYERDI